MSIFCDDIPFYEDVQKEHVPIAFEQEESLHIGPCGDAKMNIEHEEIDVTQENPPKALCKCSCKLCESQHIIELDEDLAVVPDLLDQETNMKIDDEEFQVPQFEGRGIKRKHEEIE